MKKINLTINICRLEEEKNEWSNYTDINVTSFYSVYIFSNLTVVL